jgi:hypothetical protein
MGPGFFSPTSASWLNLVEMWFSIVERQAIHRGTFGSVRELNSPIHTSSTGGTTVPTPPSRLHLDRNSRRHPHKPTINKLQTPTNGRMSKPVFWYTSQRISIGQF